MNALARAYIYGASGRVEGRVRRWEVRGLPSRDGGTGGASARSLSVMRRIEPGFGTTLRSRYSAPTASLKTFFETPGKKRSISAGVDLSPIARRARAERAHVRAAR